MNFPADIATPRTLYDKLWDNHVVRENGDGTALLYIDRHLVQEVSSPVAFEELKRRGVAVRRPLAHLAMPDHAVTTERDRPQPRGSLAALQVARLQENCGRFGIPFIEEASEFQGIVHVVGPELGFTLPGCTIVCGDSHTSTHGAFGALAFGIGASQCEMVLATQCLDQPRLRNMRIIIDGTLPTGVEIKDVALKIIARIGTDGAAEHAVEYAGSLVEALTMEQRMTLCNMTVEAGGRIGLVAPDKTTYSYLSHRPLAPAGQMWTAAVAAWEGLGSDPDAHFDSEIRFDASVIAPQVSWGTNPAQTMSIGEITPMPEAGSDAALGLAYMDLAPGHPIEGLPVQRVFIGSCTNGRIEDLRSAARVVKGRKVAEGVQAMVVPGSGQVTKVAEAEGLDQIFKAAGFSWRKAGCSMCVAMNNDRLKPGERCASTTNRNFPGRQGKDGRTHIMSPAMAAAAAVTGHIADVRKLLTDE